MHLSVGAPKLAPHWFRGGAMRGLARNEHDVEAVGDQY